MRVSHGDDEQMDADDEATGGGKKRKARSKSAAQRKRAPVTKRFHPPHGVLSPRVPAPPKGAKPPIPLNLVSARYLKEGDNATVFVSGPPVAGFDYSAFNFTAADFHEDDWEALQHMDTTDEETTNDISLALRLTSRTSPRQGQGRRRQSESRTPSSTTSRSTSPGRATSSRPPSSSGESRDGAGTSD